MEPCPPPPASHPLADAPDFSRSRRRMRPWRGSASSRWLRATRPRTRSERCTPTGSSRTPRWWARSWRRPRQRPPDHTRYAFTRSTRRGGRAVECGGLENRYASLGVSRVQIPPSPLPKPEPACEGGFPSLGSCVVPELVPPTGDWPRECVAISRSSLSPRLGLPLAGAAGSSRSERERATELTRA